MTLDEFIKHEDLTNAEAAEAIGVTGEAVRQLRKPGRVPRRKTMTIIEAWSDGAVSLKDWYG